MVLVGDASYRQAGNVDGVVWHAQGQQVPILKLLHGTWRFITTTPCLPATGSPHEGEATILDETYSVYKRVPLGPEAPSLDQISLNVHEFKTVGNGTRTLLLTRFPKQASRKNSQAIGYDGRCYVGHDGFKELDVETLEPVFTWTSEDHIGLEESFVTQEPVDERCSKPGRVWEHLNSIDKFPDGDYLLSSRRTNTIYKVSGQDGSIVWRLGGHKSDFRMKFDFSGQHSAVIQPSNSTHTIISMLDNAFGPFKPPTTHDKSRGLLVALSTLAMTAEVLAEYPHPTSGYATSRGNMQVLPNQHVWMGWSDHTLQSEHAADGSLIMKAQFYADISSYRSFKLPWVGRPRQPPDIRGAVVKKYKDTYTVVHMSWNGATEVKEWHVFHTDVHGKHKTLAAKAPKYGFETAVWTEGRASHVLAVAIGAAGEELGQSYVFPVVRLPQELDGTDSIEDHAGWDTGNSSGLQDAHQMIESRWSAMASNPVVTFIVGIVVSLLLALSLKVLRPFTMGREAIRWWQRTGPAYEAVLKEDDHRMREDDFHPHNVELQKYLAESALQNGNR